MNATEPYVQLWALIMLYKMLLTFVSVEGKLIIPKVFVTIQTKLLSSTYFLMVVFVTFLSFLFCFVRNLDIFLKRAIKGGSYLITSIQVVRMDIKNKSISIGCMHSLNKSHFASSNLGSGP